MRKSQFTFRLVSASRLALFVVGFSFVAPLANADTVTLDPPLDHYLVTNLVFYSEDAYSSYTNVILIRADSLSQSISNALQHFSILEDDLNNIQQVLLRALTLGQWSDDNTKDQVQSAYYALGDVDTSAARDLEVLRQDVRSVSTAVRSGANVQSLDITLTAGVSTNGCCCPDYSSILASIDSSLVEIRQTRLIAIQNILLQWTPVLEMIIGYDGENLDSLLFGIEEALGGVSCDVGARQLTEWAYWCASNRVSIMSEWERISSRYDPWSIVYSSDPFVSALSPAFQGIRQLFAEDWESHYNRNTFVDAFRDFYLDPPLDVSVTNEVWVSFTNSVILSDSTLYALTNGTVVSFSTGDLTVNVTNWGGLASMLQSIVVCVSNNVDVSVNAEFEIAQEKLDLYDTDAENQTLEYPRSSVSAIEEVTSHAASVLESYRSMFSSLPLQAPSRIFLHPGWSLGGIEVPSLYWELSSSSGDTRSSSLSSFFTLVRGCFSAIWVVGFLTTIYVFIAVDLFVVGVCFYVVYGLLSGKSKVAVDGIFWCFKVVASLLGFKTS